MGLNENKAFEEELTRLIKEKKIDRNDFIKLKNLVLMLSEEK